jgi:MFS family permease
MEMTTAAPAYHRSAAYSSPPILVCSAFALFGLLFSVWQVVLPDLQRALRLSPGALGTALTGGFLASFPMIFAGGRLADRWGAQALITGMALLMMLAFLALMAIDRYWLLVMLLLVLFGASGAFDVGINTAAISVEQITGRRVMAYCHAAFSGTAALVALSTGFLIGSCVATVPVVVS